MSVNDHIAQAYCNLLAILCSTYLYCSLSVHLLYVHTVEEANATSSENGYQLCKILVHDDVHTSLLDSSNDKLKKVILSLLLCCYSSREERSRSHRQPKGHRRWIKIDAMLKTVITGIIACSSALILPAQRPLSLPYDAHLRPIAASDIDDAADVAYYAFKPDPASQYALIDQNHENYTRRCIREEAHLIFDHMPEYMHANVIVIPEDRNERVVAVAFWEILSPGQAGMLEFNGNSLIDFGDVFENSGNRPSCADRVDLNVTRSQDYKRQTDKAMLKYVRNAETSQMYLRMLATHPDFDGNGFAAAHLRWGMSQAAARDLPITLFSSPVGYSLYDSVGFTSVANVTIEMLDGLGELWEEFMRWDSS